MTSLHLTADEAADALLSTNGFALLIGMLLDQQIAMEVAFKGPARLADRLDGPLTPATIVATDPDDLAAIFRMKPALHRYPGAMAKRVQALAQQLVDEHDGRAESIWESAATGAELKKRLQSLPGFGEQKAKIFVALLGKQCDVQPEGWRQAAGDYGRDGYRSIADVTGPDALEQVRAFKQAKKTGTS